MVKYEFKKKEYHGGERSIVDMLKWREELIIALTDGLHISIGQRVVFSNKQGRSEKLGALEQGMIFGIAKGGIHRGKDERGNEWLWNMNEWLWMNAGT